MATKAKRERRPRQPALLQEMEPPRIEALDDAADAYHEAKEQRMELTKEEAKLKARVKELMVEHDLTTYATASDLIVTREHVDDDDIKVKRKKSPPKPGDDGEDEE